MAWADLGAALLRRLPPERAHDLAIAALKHGLGRQSVGDDPESLKVRAFGRDLANPIGLAAGFDKDAEAVAGLFELGFGFAEVGTVTPKPQPGNPKPRIFRLSADQAIVNRLGFNSAGLDVADANLGRYRRTGGRGVVGVNLGMNKTSDNPLADYEAGLRRLSRYADYVTINVSSPNTPGLRALQGKDKLAELLRHLQAVRKELMADAPPALLLKIAPDLSDQDRADIAEIALDLKLDGLIVSNTTTARPDSLKSASKAETGGLSGRPLFQPSTELLAEMTRRTEGRLLMVGVGGVASGADAYAKIRAGANLVQLYTALIYDGPEAVGRIKRELADLLAGDGFATVADARGRDLSGG
ncbi:quinone-dependent dihydroorotate dehydrogenase [Rhodovibrio salinarum]|uniref:Dihydroorotate dehydrogenase (quinone) n=1 Tax=Rhodovibrio salinarum TaxID=1087 RepID=A0A934QMH1_9PROT|nr:quinone-dependent dihydroorotate dehydrogenase [Rhodovibrio salinarum]MBK1699258.1 quinone-dependent dihydroorotate dehydrogenase [Rhodovibrio salinarum]